MGSADVEHARALAKQMVCEAADPADDPECGAKCFEAYGCSSLCG